MTVIFTGTWAGLPVTVCARRSNPLLGPAEAVRDSEERGAIYAVSATPVYTYDCLEKRHESI